jgi:hypothetical protein
MIERQPARGILARISNLKFLISNHDQPANLVVQFPLKQKNLRELEVFYRQDFARQS